MVLILLNGSNIGQSGAWEVLLELDKSVEDTGTLMSHTRRSSSGTCLNTCTLLVATCHKTASPHCFFNLPLLYTKEYP